MPLRGDCMLFVGIDLAWSEKNNTGIAIIEGDEKRGRLLNADIVVSDSEITDYVSGKVGKKDALIAIDAPLVVPNVEGRRIAEKIVGDLFRKYDAGAHPANRTRLGAWSNGKIRGEELVKALQELGFKHNPNVKGMERTRKLFEVYPHPSTVVLFGLNSIIKYKAKPNREEAFRISEFKRYERLIKGLSSANPSLKIGSNVMLGDKMNAMRQSELKKHEDMLDAVFCAYIAYYYWKHPDKCAILGSMKEGYIVTPIFDHMKGTQKNLF